METCDGAPAADPALEAALALELPPSAGATVAVRACEGGVWVLAREGYPPRRLDLSALVPRLRRRAVALLAAELLEAEELSAVAVPASDPLRLRPRRDPEAARALLLRALVEAEPEPAPPEPWLELELAAAGRVYLGSGLTPVAGGVARLTLWRRLALGLEGAGTAAGGLGLLQVGVRLLELPLGPGWRLEVGLHAEGGVAVARRPSAAVVDWLAGGAARAGVGRELVPGWELRLAVSTGYLVGGPLGTADPAATGVTEPFLGVQLGASWAR